ncbi:hypothetical protein SBRCBS47491_009455 [Sporothrix bragantina]|uniref:Cellulose-binding Sde182 nucleoside hydrolase-like domain-containing protein n=1 Tax=Sporothrix bragantina TaxID=671064 RepID=A0ABP0CWH1_9PEZI
MAQLRKLATVAYKPRIFILTDMLNEPDDSESLVRYLLYANEFDTRGICATTSTWLRTSTHPEEIRRILTAYGTVVERLNRHVHPDFPYQSVEHFQSLVTSGPSVYGKKAFNEPVSEGALRLLAALRESEEPLYVPVWGGVNTLAQALKHLSATAANPEEAAILRSRLRVYAISDQDDTGPWIRTQFSDVFYIISAHGWNVYGQGTWTGIHAGGGTGPDKTKVLNPWLHKHIQVGTFGAEAYPDVKFGMEGDTPSFLWLVQNGLGNREHITWGGWGGRYMRPQSEEDCALWGADANHYLNTEDERVRGDDGGVYTSHQATIWRWRDAMQDDFAARMHWTLTDDFEAAAHPPVVVVNGHVGPEPLMLKVAPGSSHVLDAIATYMPDVTSDGHSPRMPLDFVWLLYTDINGFNIFGPRGNMKSILTAVEGAEGTGNFAKNDHTNTAGFSWYARGAQVQVSVPEVTRNPQTLLVTPDFHVVLQVTNRAGPYPVRRYKRVVFSFEYDDTSVPMGKIPLWTDERIV